MSATYAVHGPSNDDLPSIKAGVRPEIQPRAETSVGVQRVYPELARAEAGLSETSRRMAFVLASFTSTLTLKGPILTNSCTGDRQLPAVVRFKPGFPSWVSPETDPG